MDRTNESSTGYIYGGQQYQKQTKTDSQGNTYTVDIPVSSAIPISTVTAQSTPMNVPQPQPQTDYNQITTGVTSPYLEQLQLQQQQDLANQNTQMSDISSLQNFLSGKGEFQAQQAQAQGLTQAQADIIKKNAEMVALNKQALAAQQENISQGRQLGSVASFVAGQGNEIERNRAIRALSIGAELDALQGNLQVAQMKVQQAVDAKYSSAEQDLKNRLQMFDLNAKVMESRSQAEQKAWDRARYAVEQAQKKLDEKKKNETDIQNMIIEATPNAPKNIIAQAKKIAEQGGSKLAVAQALGEYAGDYWGTKLKIAQYQNTLSQTAKNYAEVVKAREAAIAANGTGSSSAVSPADQAKFLLDTINQASNLSSASGRSAGRRKLEQYAVGATDYTNLESKVRTIKNNLLTLATDPNIKKFFGPQMTEADVKNMLGAATTLDTEGQTPAELKAELERAQKIFQKFAPGYIPQTVKQETPSSWATGISSMWSAPATGGNYGFTDNKQ